MTLIQPHPTLRIFKLFLNFFQTLAQNPSKTRKNINPKTASDQPILQTIRNLVIYLLVAGEELTKRAPSRKQ